MKTQKQAMTREQEVIQDTVIDYAANMFADGNNRTAQGTKIKNAKAYDEAVKVADPEITDMAELPIDGQVAIAQSRDGTEASGTLDEDGGHLGGTEAELDSLEASAAPVDRTPNMKA